MIVGAALVASVNLIFIWLFLLFQVKPEEALKSLYVMAIAEIVVLAIAHVLIAYGS